ncbi:histidine kinase N-terminal 7TM domain-containing protein [Natrinema halophilum]|uniref:histidine kinase n=1 Tax=Natrinema halophilum TaxID=1699371 RepID=A0A7D5KC11_9EURY|nr:histidine kinase N-terminal 7TM domain-containing protein [Natrinema halophilum]QLG48201.1 PAS domain-containing protein [Natrinema halophilum]
MRSGDVIFLVIYAIATITSFAVAGVIYHYRDKKGAIPLAAYMFGSAIWAGSLLVATAVDDFALSVFFQKLLYVGVGIVVLSVFIFALEYTGRERYVRPGTIGLLFLEPIVVLALVFPNPDGIFYATLEPNPAMPTGVGFEFGPAFLLHTAYSYLLLIGTTLMIFEMLYSSQSLYRGQSLALLAGTVFTWIMNIVHVVGPINADITPLGFMVGGTLYSVAIIRYRLTDIVPIARDRVLDNVSDGVFVLDRDDRLIDVNPVGKALLEDIDSSPIGERVDSLFATWPTLHDGYESLTATPTDGEHEFALDAGHFYARATPIDDGRDRHVGWLLIVRDITDRKRREAQLKRQNERLERFADVVSHDLRNPLNVADGYLELASEADDPESHLDEIEQSHDRMKTIIEDVLTLARDGTDVTDPEPVSLTDLAEGAWENVDTGDATLTVASNATILGDANRVTRLFENLFRNSVEHGTPKESNDSTEVLGSNHTSLDVEVGTIDTGATNDPTGFYVADDGHGLPDGGDRIFEDGYTTEMDGTGFGLRIVDEIATAHGWIVEAAESDAGGARFDFRGVETGTNQHLTDFVADIEGTTE